MGLTAKYDLAQLQLRAYSLLVDEQSHQVVSLLYEHVDTELIEHEAPHRLLELVRIKARQFQVTGDNLEGAMRLLKEAKEATNNPMSNQAY